MITTLLALAALPTFEQVLRKVYPDARRLDEETHLSGKPVEDGGTPVYLIHDSDSVGLSGPVLETDGVPLVFTKMSKFAVKWCGIKDSRINDLAITFSEWTMLSAERESKGQNKYVVGSIGSCHIGVNILEDFAVVYIQRTGKPAVWPPKRLN